jgi:hypothetical protein
VCNKKTKQKKTLTVVPEEIASNLAVLKTLIALNNPICPPALLSTPKLANTKHTQKLTIATKSIRLQLCRRYGTFRRVLSCTPATLRRKGREIVSVFDVEEEVWVSDRRALVKKVGWEELRRWLILLWSFRILCRGLGWC